jgi:hypothetical protein
MTSAAMLAFAAPSFAQSSLVGNSPFAPSGSAASGGKAADQDFELAGSSAEGSNVSVCIFERHAKHSQWIPVGGMSDGIRVVSFDSSRDRAVVIVGGQRKEISMRIATVASLPSSAPMRTAQVETQAPSPALVPVGQPPAVTGTPEQQQREARMLVSDLLEIGVQQRKAYQDAKLKAAQGATAAPAN